MRYNQYLFQPQNCLEKEPWTHLEGCSTECSEYCYLHGMLWCLKSRGWKYHAVLTWVTCATLKLKFSWKESFSPLQRRLCWSQNEASWSACKCSALSSEPTQSPHFQMQGYTETLPFLMSQWILCNAKSKESHSVKRKVSPNVLPFNPLPFEGAVFPSRLLKPSVPANSPITELSGLRPMELRAVHCCRPHLPSLFEIAWAQKRQNEIIQGLRPF